MTQITEALRRTAEHLQANGFQTRATAPADASETKLLVRRYGIEVRSEANFVMRGTLYPVQRASLTKVAQDLLLADLELPIASGKMSTEANWQRRRTASIRVTCST